MVIIDINNMLRIQNLDFVHSVITSFITEEKNLTNTFTQILTNIIV